MITQNLKLIIPLSVALVCGSAAVSAAPLVLGNDLKNLTVFSNTYTTTGADSHVYGNVLSGGVSTTGAHSEVSGNLSSVGAANIGANAIVGGNMLSGGAATTGDSANVLGDLWSGGAASVGANSTVSGNLTSTRGPITIAASGHVGGSQTGGGIMPAWSGVRSSVYSESAQVTDAQNFLSGLGSGTTLDAVPVSMTLAPGVYSAPSLSLTAGNTITLDGQNQPNPSWVFNIRDVLAPGANTTVSLINAGPDASVFWNVSYGYASIGANSTFLGTILADTYVSVGAGTTVSGIGFSCGGIFSATSYVSTGAGASIGEIGCSGMDMMMPVAD